MVVEAAVRLTGSETVEVEVEVRSTGSRIVAVQVVVPSNRSGNNIVTQIYFFSALVFSLFDHYSHVSGCFIFSAKELKKATSMQPRILQQDGGFTVQCGAGIKLVSYKRYISAISA